MADSIYARHIARFSTKLRGVLIAAVYDKTTTMSVTKLDNSAAVTLMGTDVERLTRSLRILHEIWANVIQVAVVTWLLQRQVGIVCIAPIVVCISTLNFSFYG